jgi:ABC-type enterobactin transport system permease subunit
VRGRLESKIANVVLRCFDLCSAATVAAIVGRTIYIVKVGSNRADARSICVESIAVMTIVMSIVLTIASKCAFVAWPMDFVVYA